MLTHGVAPADLLLSTLVPIPKNKRGNKSDLNNYRQIAIRVLAVCWVNYLKLSF